MHEDTRGLRGWMELRKREIAAPLTILAACGTLALIACAACTLLALRGPALGLRLEAADQGLVVTRVARDSDALGRVRAGDTITAIATSRLAPMALEATDVEGHPDGLSRYTEQSRLLQRQAALAERLRAPQVQLGFTDGRAVALRPIGSRRIEMLPATFWLLLGSGVVGLLSGSLVAAFRREQTANVYYALTGFGLFVACAARALAGARELAMDGNLLGLFFKLEYLGLAIFWWGLVATLWYYPEPLGRIRAGRWLGVPFLLMWAWDFFELPSSLDLGRRLPLIAGFASAAFLAVLQWRRTRGHLVERTALRWFLLAWFSGTAFYVGSVLVPPLLGRRPLTDAAAYLSLLLLHAGIALGIARYRLFDLDRWSMLVWLWFVGGLVVIAADAILVYLVEVNSVVALSVSLIFVGWVYLPMRQLMWERLGWTPAKVDFERLFPGLLRELLAHDGGRPVAEPWNTLLLKLYRPLALRALPCEVPAVRRHEHGMRLLVPGLAGAPAMEIVGAHHGTRLMGPEDERFVGALWQLFHSVHHFRDSFEQGAAQERTRVARDLHDDVAADLLPVIYEIERPATRHRLQAVFAELRAIMQGMEASEQAVGELFASWEIECRLRCEAGGVELQWRLDGGIGPVVDARTGMNLRAILKEAASNALQHARARHLEVQARIDGPLLIVQVDDDGIGCDGVPRSGRGLRIMRARAQEIAATLTWGHPEAGRGTRVELRLPLDHRGPTGA